MSKIADWTTEEALSLISHWKRNDLTNEQICEKMGISETTFYRWQQEKREFREALKKGTEELIAKAEEALETLVNEHEITETIIEEWTENGKVVKSHKRVIKKKVPADVTATIFTLKSKGKWSDKPVVEEEFTKARTRELQGENDKDIEDLSSLADILKYDKDTDN